MSGALVQIVLPLSLFIIMLGIGMTLVINDFKRVMIYSRAVSLGMIGQLAILPVVAYAITQIFPVSPELAVGIMILAVCPGGTTSNIISHIAKGDTALSITLTAISSVITIITIPLIISFSLSHFMGGDSEFILPIRKTMLTLFAITLLPVSIGMFIKSKAPAFADAQENRMNAFAMGFFLLLVILICYKERENLLNAIKLAGVACLVLNVFMMTIAYLAAKLFKLNERQSKTITIEIGVQNTTLAFVIAGTILTNPTFALPAAIYSLFMYLTTGTMIAWSRKKK